MSDSDVRDSELSLGGDLSSDELSSSNGAATARRGQGPSTVRLRRSRGRPRSRADGRGRGRGASSRARARGRGGGRGRLQSVSIRTGTTSPDLQQVQQERKEYVKDKEEGTSERQVKDVLLKIAERHPAVVLGVLQLAAAVHSQGHHPLPPGGQNLPWCSCGNCRDMPTPAERICCGMNPDACLSSVPDFNILILDEAVLALGRLYRQDALVFPEEENYNKANRHQAYRQYILWIHGRLTVGDRRVIPSCCVWKIRDKYPDPYGQYVGFVPGRLQ